MVTLKCLHEHCNSHDTFLMVTPVVNVYQLRQGLQNFVILKVTQKEIWEVFQELSNKVRSKDYIELNRQKAIVA